MSKIVLELQQEAYQSETDIISLLRKAYLVAKKLNLKEFEEWLDKELNGYKDKQEVPEYRLVKVEDIRYKDSAYIMAPNITTDEEIQKKTFKVKESIANLWNTYKNVKIHNAIVKFDGIDNIFLSQRSDFNYAFDCTVVINTAQVYYIFERVRNIILDWSIELENNGILGEGIQFNEEEKNIATNTPTIYNINNFFSSANEIQIQQDTKASSQNKH